MDIRQGNSVWEQKNDQTRGSWIPATPQRSILARRRPIYAEGQNHQIGHADWRRPQGFPTDISQGNNAHCVQVPCFESTNSLEPNRGTSNWEGAMATKVQVSREDHKKYCRGSFDPMAGWNNVPFVQLLAQASSGRGMPSMNVTTSSPSVGTSNSQIRKDGLWTGLANFPENQDTSLGTNNSTNKICSPPTFQGKLHIPHRQIYDLNSAPEIEANSFADENTNRGTNVGTNEVMSTRFERSKMHFEEELEQAGSSSAVVTTPVKSHDTDDGGMDINTPQQKSRRKKHRPKVITEGKPKRTPKKETPKLSASSENPMGKRKYVRKKGLNNSSSTPPTDLDGEKIDKKINAPTRRSSKRSLNFDLEGQVRDESSSTGLDINVNTATQVQQSRSDETQPKITVHIGQGMEVPIGNSQSGIAYELTRSINQLIKDYISSPTNTDPSHPPVTEADTKYEDLKMDTQIEDRMKGMGQVTADDKGKFDEMLSHYSTHSAQRSHNYNGRTAVNMSTGQTKRNKKDNYHTISGSTMNLVGAQYNSIHTYQELHVNEFGNKIHYMHFPDIYKKRRTEKGQNSTKSNTSSVTTAGNIVRNQIASTAHCWNSTTQFDIRAPNTAGVSGVTQEGLQSIQHMLALGRSEKWTKKRSKGPTRVRDLSTLIGISKSKVPPTSISSLADDQGLETSSSPNTCMESLVAEIRKTMAKGKRSKKRNSAFNSVSSEQLHQTNTPYNHSGFFSQSIAPPPDMIWEHLIAVDAIVDRLKQLNINREGKIAYQECNALVPYNTRYQSQHAIVSRELRNQEQNALVIYGRDGTVIPFDGSFYHIKKRRPRAKVDLDDETTRVWKLLLENIDNEGIDGTDEEKAKWWEEERRVFRGRADSFIARMHLVQGDRRFSQWKGSVVDSVIGVFLTQNVSDHLSSSAFMSLAAHFPLKSKSNDQPSHEEGTTIVNAEPEVRILDLIETITWKEGMSNNEVPSQSFMTHSDPEHNEEKEVVNSNELFDSRREVPSSSENSKCKIAFGTELQMFSHSSENSSATKTAGTGLTCVIEGDLTTTEDVVSSQGSVVSSQSSPDSSFAQTIETIGLFSESISEAYPAMESKSDSSGKSNSFVKLVHMAETPMFHKKLSPGSSHVQSDESLKEVDNITQRLDDQRRQNLDAPGGPQSSSGLSSLQGGINHIAENQCCPDGEPNNVESLEPGQYNKGQHLGMLNFTRETTVATECTSATINQKTADQAVVSKLTKPAYSSDRAFYESNLDALKAKKRRVGRDFNHAFDWDSLRKQAQANDKKRERTADTMDSLDYEAVRCADVNEIANTIKERGMNNMLAERMKDFLNRLVREHGSIDLEWLRDVPPDKAKEYLLSIRGLGLKSVECVRLLTLHHLAFPVDTNVGRIAVRLGWVPLQPLPESLQLHLLEMYPILESIQKYLWPRLCKLDQRTLYELHYQMITFGKVFCTKSKPNCNACPMRGECRHFASAFASARLALPGPEEKSIVSTTERGAGDHNPTMMSNPIHLLPPMTTQQSVANSQLQINQQPEAQSKVINCKPIIEEPKTPEPESVPISESEIEDAGYEDPEEIPTIKLNIEQFTQNLQNYMQQNMELREGDVSKALVALTSEAASLPTPKLKNVSRLRTEHQVYELPDSHPLLDGLDKREPDDPCSYLLAIWTPGETADSIQPPEGKCCSQEFGKLCNENTCFSCNSTREANSQTVRGTLLIPCRTAMRGSFPLNGTYFQVNEVFADHDSSLNPIDVPRAWIWNLPRRTVFFGTSIPTIFKGLSTEGIQYCFWRGFVCVRGFDQKTRAPRPLMARLHFPASKLTKSRGNTNNEQPVPQSQ